MLVTIAIYLEDGPSEQPGRRFASNLSSGSVSLYGPNSPFCREIKRLIIVVALQSIRVTDAQDTEVLSVNVQNGHASKVIASNEAKRPIEFIQVPILAVVN